MARHRWRYGMDDVRCTGAKSPARQQTRQPSRAPGTFGGKVREAPRIERIPATDGSSRSSFWQARIDVSKKKAQPGDLAGPSKEGPHEMAGEASARFRRWQAESFGVAERPHYTPTVP